MIRIGGLEPFSTVDYPGHLAAVVFCQGCPWHCVYCHNRHLQPTFKESPIDFSEVLNLLTVRQGLLDGVVFSGGEPLLQNDLPDAIKAVRALKGYDIAVHTAGMFPDRLKAVMPHLNWVGLDIKVPLDEYPSKIDANANPEDIEASLDLLLSSGIHFEARTTLDPSILNKNDVERIADFLAGKGVRTYCVQAFRGEGGEEFFTDPGWLDNLRNRFQRFIVRS